MVVVPVNVFTPDKVSNPLPAFVKDAADEPSAITPVIDDEPVLVIDIAPSIVIAGADKIPVVMVVFPSAALPPTAPVKVTLPLPAAIVRVLASELLELDPVNFKDDN